MMNLKFFRYLIRFLLCVGMILGLGAMFGHLAAAELSAAKVSANGTDEIVFNDFESNDYGSWQVEGTAFGTEPAAGTLPQQMKVTGYLGKKLVNTYYKGDGSIGTLTSSSFKIERNYIAFLIGGGGHSGTHIDLLIDGKVVRTAAGPNVIAGGSESLEWFSWDVRDLLGKTSVIQIVDQETGGWGHINVDQITFTNHSKQVLCMTRSITMENRYLHLPVKTGNRETWFKVLAGEDVLHEFIIELAITEQDVSFYATLDLGDYQGKTLTLLAEKVLVSTSASDADNGLLLASTTVTPHQPIQGLETILQSNDLLETSTAYSEKYRPQFHFTPRRGWTNDPNGLVYYNGTWHLFFQHNPFGVRWNNMSWGHATSSDLFHWTEQSDALLPDKLGTIFSGSAVVDWKNTSGFQQGKDSPLIALYTYNGPSMRYGHAATQALAWSADAGKTWHKYDKNPVLPHLIGGNRDPKVFWHEPTKHWIMALYMDKEDYALFGSTDLKSWEKRCDIKNLGCSECPDMFELPVDGDSNHTKWVFWGGNGKYLLGTFDGSHFTKESEPLPMKWGGNDYAAQSYSDTPGRRIQFSWMQGGTYPDMPFNQQFTLPRELTLKTTKEGIRLCTYPVRELDTLHDQTSQVNNIVLQERTEITIPNSELLDIKMTITPGAAETTLNLCGRKITLEPTSNLLVVDGVKAPLFNEWEVIELRIVLDRMSIEVFVNGGLSQIAQCFVPVEGVNKEKMVFETKGNGAMLESMEINTIKSVHP